MNDTMTIKLARAAVLATVLLLGTAAEAQYTYVAGGHPGLEKGETAFILDYEISAPVGSFKNFISDWSFRGFSIEGRYMVTPKISIGGAFAGNRWQQTNSNLQVDISNNNASGNISGPVFRYTDDLSLKLVAHYYLTEGKLQPYVGVGVGGAWVYSYAQVVDLALSHDSFDFIVSPEIGLLYELASGSTSLAVNLAVRYTYTTADLVNGRASNISWLTLPVVGLAWTYY
ncbi:MAG TPA: outer membrane beta-barrel protein [Anaeromyxobacteraceae bacterium]|nr:outer membrane beta-barrel protein [Anaeromyxobacteraceae bacterium]